MYAVQIVEAENSSFCTDLQSFSYVAFLDLNNCVGYVNTIVVVSSNRSSCLFYAGFY